MCFKDIGNVSLSPDNSRHNLGGLEEHTQYEIEIKVLREGLIIGQDSIIANTAADIPSAAPSSVSVSKVTSSTVSVQWRPVECVHQNGDITGYSLQYGETGNTNIKTLISVPGAIVTETTITNLVSNTSYEISIAAANSEGTGPTSTTLSAQTLVEVIPDIPTPEEEMSSEASSAGTIIAVSVVLLLIITIIIITILVAIIYWKKKNKKKGDKDTPPPEPIYEDPDSPHYSKGYGQEVHSSKTASTVKAESSVQETPEMKENVAYGSLPLQPRRPPSANEAGQEESTTATQL